MISYILILFLKDKSGKEIEDFVFSKKEEKQSGVFYYFVPKILDAYTFKIIYVELESESGSFNF